LIAAGKATSGPAALVVVERATLTVLSERDLTDRYHLTDREATVSQLLAAGHSNGEVARLLRISIHTARHHAESVLVKLGVHTRAAVGAKLRGENTELSA